MSKMRFLWLAVLSCGWVFGDTAPVPMAEGGNIVLREFNKCGGGKVASVLREGDDYGMMLVNESGDGEKPGMMVVVARRHPAEVYRVRSLEELEAVLRSFPAGAVFYEYDRCLVPAGYGLPEGTREKVEGVIRLCGHRLDDGKDARSGPRITCTCFDDPPKKKTVSVPVRQ